MPHRLPIDATARERAYRLRGLGSLAASVLVVLAAFRLWPPALGPATADLARVEHPREQVQIDLIEPTVQRETAPPAPPPPPQDVALPPVEVPDERVVEDRVVQLDVPVLEPTPNAPPAPPAAPPSPPGPPQPEAGPAPLVERPQQSPRVVRFAEPAYPPDARRAGVHARAEVRLLIDEQGRPQNPQIVSRALIDRHGRSEAVPSLPYGLDAIILDTAMRYQFRPAQHEDRRVRSYYTIPFEVGRR